MRENVSKIIKLDGRRVKSRQKLKKALAKILRTKSLEKITIEEISKAAHVTRPTFYSNYKDLQAIAIEYVDELMQTLLEKFRTIDVDQKLLPRQRVKVLLLYYIEMLQENDGILLSAAAGRAGNEALELMRSYWMKMVLIRAEKVPHSGLSALDIEVSTHFVAGAVNSVLEAHASGKLDMNAEEVAESISLLINQGLGQTLGAID
ncbi:TetR/AcrR family transcriptional regulator [Hirschia baltica]|uniref:Putative transcriptional regulator, TetR family n=1 Tax=Hirschia baltica (strain ATCC 49814 / DSM 5838 / IFAM 1418) TaxID=582402 RepID=C6XR13_HIRBI|nr:TetR/AcrR family transcriptional regulator [Hirschia baltica]ACT60544.1 putative transcriptional regulator, TetR family [Hirschia baltica ATCC 49814]